jgi:thioredoxin 1
MAVVTPADDTNFDQEVLQATIPVVVDFWAAWCGPCRMVAPELEALATEHGDRIKVVKVDVDAAPAVARRFAISGIPTIALFRDGQATAFSVGAKPRHLIETDLGLTPAGR